MNAPETMNIERAIVTGHLECLSELHIGAGRMDEHRVTRTNHRGQQRHSDHPYNLPCLDIHDRPYLPASSLRGMLCSRLTGPPAETLFGGPRKPHDETAAEDQDYGRAGALRVYDARMAGDAATKLIRARTAVDPVTGTAKPHQLFAQQLVPQGSRFHCRFELDAVSSAELEQLLATLNALESSEEGLGHGKSLGRGRLRWIAEEQSIKVLSREKLADWLKQPAGTPLEQQFTPFENPLSTPGPQPRYLNIPLTIIPETPILVIDPIHGHEKAQNEKRDLHFTRRGDQACIPASTLKGLLRAHCRRILLTMAPELTEQRLDQELLAPLFGHPDLGRGALLFEDALADYGDGHIHAQTFNAVDRFSGGVSDSALFDLEAVKPDTFDTTLRIGPELPSWAKGLLTLALRDAMEGDLAIGWGKARGFGSVRVELGGHGNWQNLAASRSPAETQEAERWITSLAEKTAEDERT